MSGNVDLALLRQLVGVVVATLPDHYTHRGLGEACERPGLPGPPGEDGHSERERVDGSFAASATSSWPAPPSWACHTAGQPVPAGFLTALAGGAPASIVPRPEHVRAAVAASA